ncbi:MAG: hypothetical protein PHS14_20850, partial [Elusimicrobia bacterium]|nr:hypothetical protein [Elusimicrobiota bacterium]
LDSSPPEEAAALVGFLRGLASSPETESGPTPLEIAKAAVAEVKKAAQEAPRSPIARPVPVVPPPPDAAGTPPKRQPVGPFRVSYPARPETSPRAVPPEPQAPDPPADDVDDFTAPAASGP